MAARARVGLSTRVHLHCLGSTTDSLDPLDGRPTMDGRPQLPASQAGLQLHTTQGEGAAHCPFPQPPQMLPVARGNVQNPIGLSKVGNSFSQLLPMEAPAGATAEGGNTLPLSSASSDTACVTPSFTITPKIGLLTRGSVAPFGAAATFNQSPNFQRTSFGVMWLTPGPHAFHTCNHLRLCSGRRRRTRTLLPRAPF